MNELKTEKTEHLRRKEGKKEGRRKEGRKVGRKDECKDERMNE